MPELKGRIENGQVVLYPRSKEAAKSYDRKEVVVTIDNRESWEKRKFFEGAVTQYFFYQHPYSDWKDFRQARESLKLEFNGEWINDKDGKQQKIALSTRMSNAKFTEFLSRIQDYFLQNGLEWPDSEDYLKWVETAPDPEAIYPPLQKIIERYKSELTNPLPVWRRR